MSSAASDPAGLRASWPAPRFGRPNTACRWVPSPMVPADLSPLMSTVGVLVDELYPRGAEKLLARLEDALNGYAVANVVRSHRSGAPVALASEVKKGRSGIKLSTFWVHPIMRGRGIGKVLLDSRIHHWQQCGAPAATVTVREERSPELERLFVPRGFGRAALVPDRYGEGKSEVILRWTSESTPRSFGCIVA